MTRREQAMAYFKQGFNCSQSVLRAYSDLFDMPEDELMKAGQSFGRRHGTAAAGVRCRVRYVYGGRCPDRVVLTRLTGNPRKITMMWCRNWRLSLKRKTAV